MSDKYNILVTGVAGFLGSHLSEKLAEQGHNVVGIDSMIGGYEDNIPKNIKFYKIDCCDFEQVKKIMKGVNVVYHCAATAHEGLSVFSPYEITKNNYLASVSIFSAAINEKVKRIMFCSSMARYGDQKTPFLETMKPKPVDPYAISKVAAEDVFNNIPSWLGVRQTSQTITGDGSTSSAIDITSAVTEVSCTGGPLTLADGSDGQIKTIIDTASSGTDAFVITPSNLRGYTTITLNAPGETVTLMFKNSNWNIIAGNGYATA